MKYFFQSLRAYIGFTLLTGLIFPVVVTLVAKGFFYDRAKGSLVKKNGTVIGSELIAQKFTSNKYFWSRPSAVDYNPLPSGGSNLGPTSASLKTPFSSGSGLDPHISIEDANEQLARIAEARNLSPDQIKPLIEQMTEGRTFGFLGQPRINVLKLNLKLDESF